MSCTLTSIAPTVRELHQLISGFATSILLLELTVEVIRIPHSAHSGFIILFVLSSRDASPRIISSVSPSRFELDLNI